MSRENGCYVRYLNNNNEISFYVEDFSRRTKYYIIPNDELNNIQYSDYYGYYMYTGIVNELDILSDQSIISSLRLLTSDNEQILLDAIAAYEASQSNESSNNIKNIIIKKKINNVLYNIFPKSSADNIVYNDDGTTTTVQSKIDEISSALASTITSSQASSLIQQESTSLYNRIMGFSDSDTTINEAYDTLKEVATYLAGHGSVVSGFTTDINNLKTTVGGSSSGLVKDVNDLKTTVGDSSSGLVKSVADNASTISALQTTANGKSTVTSSNTNGNIKINGTETTVYTPSNIPASAITESNTKKFVTNDEKNRISNVGSVNVVTTQPTAANANSTDLYILVTDPSYNVVITSYTPSDIDTNSYYEIYEDSDNNYYFVYNVNNTNLYLKLLSSEVSYITNETSGGPTRYKYIKGSRINSSASHDVYNGNETLSRSTADIVVG